MLNPPDDGKIGITLAYLENLSEEKEQEFIDIFLRKISTFFPNVGACNRKSKGIKKDASI